MRKYFLYIVHTYTGATVLYGGAGCTGRDGLDGPGRRTVGGGGGFTAAVTRDTCHRDPMSWPTTVYGTVLGTGSFRGVGPPVESPTGTGSMSRFFTLSFLFFFVQSVFRSFPWHGDTPGQLDER